MNWTDGTELDKSQLKYIEQALIVGLVKTFIINVFFMLVICFVDFMILLGTNPEDVPTVVWIVQAILILFFTIVFVSNLFDLFKIKACRFKWRIGTITKVQYAQNTGHSHKDRYVAVDNEICYPAEGLGRFKVNDNAIVLKLSEKAIRLAFSANAEYNRT